MWSITEGKPAAEHREGEKNGNESPGEKVDLLQRTLVEQGWELQDSLGGIGVRITDLKRDIQLPLIQIKEKMAIYLAVILFVMIILVKALAFSLQHS
jgi:hypothetical protein